MSKTKKSKFYAVRVGRNPGIYESWDDCKKEVLGFENAQHKSFETKDEAHKYLISEPVSNSKQNKKSFAVKREPDNDEEADEKPILKKARIDDIKTENNKNIEVYTDGACRNNGKKSASATIGVYWGPKNPLNVSEKLPGKPTNQRAELNAAIKAIEQAIGEKYETITLHTDSSYTINCMTQWVKNWKKNKWIKSNKQPVENQQDIAKLDDLCSKIKVNWKHVKGHSGIHGNEEADRLANEAF